MIQCDKNGKNIGYVNSEDGVRAILRDAYGREPTADAASDPQVKPVRMLGSLDPKTGEPVRLTYEEFKLALSLFCRPWHVRLRIHLKRLWSKLCRNIASLWRRPTKKP